MKTSGEDSGVVVANKKLKINMYTKHEITEWVHEENCKKNVK